MGIFDDEMSLGKMDKIVREKVKNVDIWGQIDLTRTDLKFLIEKLRVFTVDYNKTIKYLFQIHPYALTSYAVFVAKYFYNGDFWGMLGEKLGCSKPGPADQKYIGNLLLRMFKLIGLKHEVGERKYVDTVLYEIGEPPESNIGDLFSIFKYSGAGSTDPSYLIEELKSTKSYQVHKPLLRFINTQPEDQVTEFILEAQDTYTSATVNGNNVGKYARAYDEWSADETGRISNSKESGSDRFEINPYLKFDEGNDGLCIVLPRQNIIGYCEDTAKWTIVPIDGSDDKIIEKEYTIQGNISNRFVEQVIVPVMPSVGYNITFSYYADYELRKSEYEISGIPHSGVLCFDSNGNKVNTRFLHYPYEMFIWEEGLNVETSDVNIENQSYPLFTGNYHVKRVTPLGTDANITIQDEVSIHVRPEIHANLNGEMLFDTDYLISEFPIYVNAPVLTLRFEGYIRTDGLSIKYDGDEYDIGATNDDGDIYVNLDEIMDTEETFGLQSIRIYQMGHFIKQVQFFIAPQFRLIYKHALQCGTISRSDRTTVSIGKIDGWNIEFINGNVDDLPDRYNISIDVSEGTLKGKIAANTDGLHVNIPFELPIAAFRCSISKDNSEMLNRRLRLDDFLESSIWVNFCFFGDYTNSSYSVYAQSVDGKEQTVELKVGVKGKANIDLTVFNDTVSNAPLPINIVLSDNNEHECTLCRVENSLRLSERPGYGLHKHTFNILDEDVMHKNIFIRKYGDPDYAINLTNREYSVENGFRRYLLDGDDALKPGLYCVDSDDIKNDLFDDDDFEISFDNDEFYVWSTPLDIKADTFSIWLERFVRNILYYYNDLELLKKKNKHISIEKLAAFDSVDTGRQELLNLILLAEFMNSQISKDIKYNIDTVMHIISRNILTVWDRYDLISLLVDMNVSETVFDIAEKGYALLLVKVRDDIPQDDVRELSDKVNHYSKKVGLMLLMNADVPFSNTIGRDYYREMLGTTAILSMMHSSKNGLEGREDIRNYIQGKSSSVKIVISEELLGRHESSIIAFKKNRMPYLDKNRIPEGAISFDGMKYVDQYANWYMNNHDQYGDMNSELRDMMKSDLIKYRDWIQKNMYNVKSSMKSCNYFNDYDTVLRQRTPDIESDDAYATYFYFEGVASIIWATDRFNDLLDSSKRYLVDALTIAPHMAERDIMLAALYVYMKKREDR